LTLWLLAMELQPHQPKSFDFPKRSFGKKVPVMRSFQASWFDRWPWLHYIESRDVVLCFHCAEAKKQKKLNWCNNADEAFISKGFYNWKDATVKYVEHESSNCHKEAVLKVVTVKSTDVADILSAKLAKDKMERRQCFLKILSNIRFFIKRTW